MNGKKSKSYSEMMQDELEPIYCMIDEGGPVHIDTQFDESDDIEAVKQLVERFFPHWTYQGRIWNPPENFTPKDWYGFVYVITNRATGKKYIGKKFFWRAKTLPITKTRKRRKKLKVESDWREYFGSNKHLQKDVALMGMNCFYREMIHLCKTKGECGYLEAKEQFENDVLLREDFYNGIISCRIGSQSVKNLK